jgi:AhpD family alkylhydroperoxidase
MTRVRLVEPEQAPLLARPYYERGRPGPIEASLATVPELLDAALPFFAAVLGPGAAPARLKEIVVLRSSARQACRYCIDSHTIVALDVGLTVAEVLALRALDAADECFTDPAEIALVAWIDAVAGSVGPIADAVADELRRHYPDHLVVELTVVAATTVLLNRYCTSLELPASPATATRLAEVGLL